MNLSRNKKIVLTYLIILLTISSLAGLTLSKKLKIKYKPKNIPDTADPQVKPYSNPAPLPNINAIIAPENALKTPLYQKSLKTLEKSIENRGGKNIDILYPSSPSSSNVSGKIIAIGSPERNSFIPRNITSNENLSHDSYTLKSYEKDNQKVLAITGGSELGDAFGIYHLSDEIITGETINIENLFSSNYTSTPALNIRMVDLGGVGIEPNRDVWWQNYSMNPQRFENVVSAEPPFVKGKAFREVKEDFKKYVQRMISLGYNRIVISGFLKFINFDRVENGYAVYGPNNIYRERQDVLRDRFRELFQYADNLGVDIVLKTDMVALTTPLEEYFEDRFGGVRPSDDDFWSVYRKGIRELFAKIPEADAMMIRIGEAGGAYNISGWDYRSELHVKTLESTQAMIKGLLPAFENVNKNLILRNWSVYVGEIGDFHTNPKTYRKVLENINSPNLIISTKYCMSDFFSYLPLNPTLETGKQKRMVELQARREFEGFSAFPNYTGPIYQAALKYAVENTNAVGTWIWNQDGGPIRSSPMSIYPFHGFWLFIDANTFATSRLAWDPYRNIGSITKSWVVKNFGDDPVVVENISRMLLSSRDAMKKGFYIKEFAGKYVKAGGLELTPMMWIFNWDRVCGATSVLSVVYYPTRDNVEGAVEEGFSAVHEVKKMKKSVSGLENRLDYGEQKYDLMLKSLNYEKSLFTTFAWYRKFYLKYYEWLETGNRESFKEWRNALDNFEIEKKKHVSKYTKNLNFPSFYFKEAEGFASRAQKSSNMIWMARALLVIILFSFLLGSNPLQKRTPDYPGKNISKALWQGTFSLTGAKINGVSGLHGGILSVLIFGILITCFAVFTFFSAPYITLFFGVSLLLFILVLSIFFLYNRNFSHSTQLFSSLSPLLILTILVMGVCSIRGPFLVWYLSWTNTFFKSLIIGTSVFVFGWVPLRIIETGKTHLETGVKSSFGKILIAGGTAVSFLGAIVKFVSLQKSIAILNKELLLIPTLITDVLSHYIVHAIQSTLNIGTIVHWLLFLIGITIGIFGTIIVTVDYLLKNR